MTPRGRTNAPHGHSGLTPHEKRVMELVDQGRKIREIARLLDRDPAAIAKVARYYDGRGDHGRACRHAAAASARLLAAIARHHPERLRLEPVKRIAA